MIRVVDRIVVLVRAHPAEGTKALEAHEAVLIAEDFATLALRVVEQSGIMGVLHVPPSSIFSRRL
jgi:hypothetical protein